jgi:hypothetical protein
MPNRTTDHSLTVSRLPEPRQQPKPVDADSLAKTRQRVVIRNLTAALSRAHDEIVSLRAQLTEARVEQDRLRKLLRDTRISAALKGRTRRPQS